MSLAPVSLSLVYLLVTELFCSILSLHMALLVLAHPKQR